MNRLLPMASADHAWLRMDSIANLVVIHLAFVFEREVPYDAVRARLQVRFAHHQFTHRVRRGWRRAFWTPHEPFAVDRHLDVVRLPAGSGLPELQALMSRQASSPLPPDRPLWDATLVHGVDGRSALVMRVHHSVADGVSLMALIGAMTDLAPGVQAVEPAHAGQRAALTAGVLLARAPRVAADAARMLFMRRDAPSALKGTPGVAKAVAWSGALSLDAVRELAHRHRATVNDAMLALIAGVLRENLLARGDAAARPVRAVIPINLRRRGELDRLGNRFGLVGLELPVELDDPVARLHAVRDRMSALKAGFQGQLAMLLLRIAGALPDAWQQALLGIFSRRGTVIVTNVIGPAEARCVDGVRLDELMLCVPQGMTVGVGVSIVSYAGQLRIGWLVDRALLPDPAAAAAAVDAQFERLRRAACAQPESEPGPEPAWFGAPSGEVS
jgi:WS/DGAT/MGAT family acyltransferase